MPTQKLVFLFDVDLTLLDNDRIIGDLRRHLEREVGHARAQRYWDLFEQIRLELGYADYLGALQQYRLENPRDPHLLTVSHFLVHYPFANRLYPESLDVLDHVRQWGEAVILSDGDCVFQPLKVEHAGLFEAVEGRVLIYVHKESELEDVEGRFPADRYVLVDDKIRILSSVKKVWGDKVRTIFVRQGHYAQDPAETAKYPAADASVGRIGELLGFDRASFLGEA